MPDVETVLVVGGGIAGLTLARALAPLGFAVEIIECSHSWRAEGGGIAVQPNAMRVLRALGLDTAVARAGMRLRRWHFCDQHGEVLCETDLEALWRDVGPFIGIGRAGLQQVLVDGIGNLPCRLGVSLQSLTQNDAQVSVTFSNGTSGTYDLVVGADGISSTVRALTLKDAPLPAYSGAMAWRSVAPIWSDGVDILRFLLGEGRFFGLCPVGEASTYGFGNITEARAHEPMAGRLNRLRDRFAGFAPMVQNYLSTLTFDEQVHCGPVEWVAVERWRCGRVVLIGDAAHASLPMMGQGGCMAMEDAYVLAECLRTMATAHEALETYVARRRSRVGWVQRESAAAAQMFRLPPAVRDSALRRSGDEMMRRRFAPLLAEP